MKQVLSIPSQLGPVLKAARKQARLSQEDLARRLGISQSRMSHMELNPDSINLGQLLALFGALGLELTVALRPRTAHAEANQVLGAFSQDATVAPGPPQGGHSKPEW